MDKPNPLERAFHILAATVVDEETRGIQFTPRSYILDLEGILEFSWNLMTIRIQNINSLVWCVCVRSLVWCVCVWVSERERERKKSS